MSDEIDVDDHYILMAFASIIHLKAIGSLRTRIAAHNENDIGVLDIHPVAGHHPSTKPLFQSRHSGGVSEAGLMLKIDNAEPPHQFANQVTEPHC